MTEDSEFSQLTEKVCPNCKHELGTFDKCIRSGCGCICFHHLKRLEKDVIPRSKVEKAIDEAIEQWDPQDSDMPKATRDSWLLVWESLKALRSEMLGEVSEK